MKLQFVIALAVAAVMFATQAHAVDGVVAPALSTEAARRAEALRVGKKTFNLTLSFGGDRGAAYHSLSLDVRPRHILQNDLLHHYPQITEAQAERLIEHLAAGGFLDAAMDVTHGWNARAELAGPGYTLTASTEEPADKRIVLTRHIGWSARVLTEVSAIAAALDGDAARDAKTVLGALADRRAAWEMRTSAALAEAGVEFQAAAQGVWEAPVKPGVKTDVPIELVVTNRTAGALRFNLFDTLRIELRDAAGNALQIDGGRNGTKPSWPLAVSPGESRAVVRDAKLEPAAGAKGLRLIGQDRSGGIWYFDGLMAGKYTLSFTYENAPVAAGAAEVRGAAPFWTGKVATKDVAIEIAAPAAAAKP